MKRLLITGILVLSWWMNTCPGALADDSISSALPAHAQLLQRHTIVGHPSAVLVEYKTQHFYLGIVQQKPHLPQLIWHRRLPAIASIASTAQIPGLFEGLIPAPSGDISRAFAFVLRDNDVTSAFENDSSGFVQGDEGIVLGSNSIRVGSRDWSHSGSVRYRIETTYSWSGTLFRVTRTEESPNYSPARYPHPNGVVHTQAGDIVLIRFEIASTEQQRETGLMYRRTLDPDSGMIFVWDSDTQESFWMDNTFLPLTVAFLDANGRIQEMQDMAPLTTDLHTPAQPYRYAIEVNQGFFAKHGIRVGDTVALNLASSQNPGGS